MTEPMTAAGRRWAANPDWWLIEGERQRARECIAAIEREAAAAERERIRAAMKGLEATVTTGVEWEGLRVMGRSVLMLDRDAVLAIIDEEAAR